MKSFTTILFLFTLNIFAKNIEVINPTLKLTPPTMNVTAAFFTITNNGDKEVKLLRVTGEFAKEFEIHEMKMENGSMKMRPIVQLIVPSHKTIELKHGGYHIMIFGLKKPLEENQEYKLNLIFDHNQKIEIKAKAILVN